jgi:hypothetical protein
MEWDGPASSWPVAFTKAAERIAREDAERSALLAAQCREGLALKPCATGCGRETRNEVCGRCRSPEEKRNERPSCACGTRISTPDPKHPGKCGRCAAGRRPINEEDRRRNRELKRTQRAAERKVAA